MSFAKVHSAQNYLLTSHIIDIEVDLSRGLHSFMIVGLPDKAVEESRDRISSAIKNSGFESPKQKNEKTIVSLAPADIKKEGTHFDLGIAIAYLIASGDIPLKHTEKMLFIGELSLDGTIREVNGVLPLVHKAQEVGYTSVFVPYNNATEAAVIPNITIYGVNNLGQVVSHIKGIDSNTDSVTQAPQTDIGQRSLEDIEYDLSHIKGQESAKRALLIACAGGHNINLYGPPGTGKSMLAKTASGILPELTFEEVIEVTGIHSAAGQLREDYVISPPVRSPHHTASYVSVVGGGANPKPGEITLAHRGILFLDEFPEFDRKVLESLREPLEEKTIRISRAKGTVTFPADIILISAMNPCPCGFYGSNHKQCVCAPYVRERYNKKISGPIMDRIDIWTEVEHIPHEKLMNKEKGGMTSFEAKEKIKKSREIQKQRFAKHGINIKVNARIPAQEIEALCNYTKGAIETLNKAGEKLHLSPRAYHRILRLARTIADLEEVEQLDTPHILEALQYRPKIN